MNNQTIFNQINFKKLFRNGLKRVCNFQSFEGKECIALAFVKPIEMPLPIVTFMNEWVDAIEKKIETTEKHSPQYADWLSIRCFTYDEFRWVIETAFSEDKLQRVPVYSFLYLDDAIAVEEFKIKFGNKEESIRLRYLKALAFITKNEFPELYKFLCADKITLKYPIEAFQKHSYCLAQSSSGKSELNKHIFHELVNTPSKKTVLLLEPHRDLSVEVLQLKAVWIKGLNNVIYLDPDINQTSLDLVGVKYDVQYQFSLNPFEQKGASPKEISFLVEHLSKAFFGIIKSEETFQMEAIIEACVETLLKRPNSDILDLKRFMDNDQNEDLIIFAQECLEGERLALMSNRFKSDPKIQQTKSSIYYRLQSILGKKELVDCLVGECTVDLKKFMDVGKTIICNFSKASLGPDGAPMLGKLLMGLFSGYATLRQYQRKAERTETYVFIDEFQNYINPGSTEEIFAEQRKYKTYFYVSNQQMGQSMSGEIKKIIAGNTALKFMGDNETESVEWFSKQFKKLPQEATFNLPKYSFWFYDKFNKDLGSFILRCPSYLVERSETYYLNKEELKIVFDYLLHKSGLYKRVPTNTKKGISGRIEDSVLKHNFTN